jgi:quercetin dioxygenase-like cupin family protein
MFLRIYAGNDGQSHFEEMDIPSGPAGRSPVQAVKTISFTHQKPGTVIDFHTVPERSYYITLSGAGEVGIGNGEVRRIGPGDITLCEDLTGQGHSMRIVSKEPRVFARIVLA